MFGDIAGEGARRDHSAGHSVRYEIFVVVGDLALIVSKFVDRTAETGINSVAERVPLQKVVAHCEVNRQFGSRILDF